MFSCADTCRANFFRQTLRATASRIALPFLRNRDGVTAIEFAITLPVLLLIVFGTIEFGRALKARNEMSHALSQAVRVINLDTEKTTGEIKEILSSKLASYGSEDLAVNTSNTTLEGTDYMRISVSFPFHATIPLSNTSVLDLKVETLAPIIAPEK